MREKLIGFNSHTIYNIYNKNHNKVIQVKNLRNFEEIFFRTMISLLNFERKLKFDGVQILDKQKLFDKSSNSEKKRSKL